MSHRILRFIFQASIGGRFLPRTLNGNTFIHYSSAHNGILFKYIPSISITTRNYSKARNKGGDKKKTTKVEVSSSEMSEFVDMDKLRDNFEKHITKMKEEFAQHLQLRSSIGALDGIKVKHDGTVYQLQDIAQIIRKNPKTIVLNLSSFPQTIPSVLKAIESSGMNLNPQQDGTTLFIPIPKITKEHRENLSKNSKVLYIKCRDNIKQVHLDYVKKVKNKDKTSEDLVLRITKQIEAMKDKYVEEAKLLHDSKLKEIMGT